MYQQRYSSVIECLVYRLRSLRFKLLPLHCAAKGNGVALNNVVNLHYKTAPQKKRTPAILLLESLHNLAKMLSQKLQRKITNISQRLKKLVCCYKKININQFSCYVVALGSYLIHMTKKNRQSAYKARNYRLQSIIPWLKT